MRAVAGQCLSRMSFLPQVLNRVVDEGVDVLPEDLQELSELVEKETRLIAEAETVAANSQQR